MATTTNITSSTTLSSTTKNDINYRFTNASGRFQASAGAKIVFNRCDFTATVTLTKTVFLYGTSSNNANIQITFNDCTFHDISINTDEGTFILMQGTGNKCTFNNCTFNNMTFRDGTSGQAAFIRCANKTNCVITLNNTTFGNMTDPNGSGLMFCSGSGVTVNASDVVFPEGSGRKNSLQFGSGTTLNLSGDVRLNSDVSCQTVNIDEDTHLRIAEGAQFTYAAVNVVDSEGNPSPVTYRTIVRNGRRRLVTFDLCRRFRLAVPD